VVPRRGSKPPRASGAVACAAAPLDLARLGALGFRDPSPAASAFPAWAIVAASRAPRRPPSRIVRVSSRRRRHAA
jgi:hypothetical protein